MKFQMVLTGDIIFQRQYEFNISSEKFSTFKKTYIFLFKALENLFIENFEKIINYSYSRKKQGNSYTIHRAIDLKDLTNWDTNIQEYLKKIINKICTLLCLCDEYNVQKLNIL